MNTSGAIFNFSLLLSRGPFLVYVMKMGWASAMLVPWCTGYTALEGIKPGLGDAIRGTGCPTPTMKLVSKYPGMPWLTREVAPVPPTTSPWCRGELPRRCWRASRTRGRPLHAQARRLPAYGGTPLVQHWPTTGTLLVHYWHTTRTPVSHQRYTAHHPVSPLVCGRYEASAG